MARIDTILLILGFLIVFSLAAVFGSIAHFLMTNADGLLVIINTGVMIILMFISIGIEKNNSQKLENSEDK